MPTRTLTPEEQVAHAKLVLKNARAKRREARRNLNLVMFICFPCGVLLLLAGAEGIAGPHVGDFWALASSRFGRRAAPLLDRAGREAVRRSERAAPMGGEPRGTARQAREREGGRHDLRTDALISGRARSYGAYLRATSDEENR